MNDEERGTYATNLLYQFKNDGLTMEDALVVCKTCVSMIEEWLEFNIPDKQN